MNLTVEIWIETKRLHCLGGVQSVTIVHTVKVRRAAGDGHGFHPLAFNDITHERKFSCLCAVRKIMFPNCFNDDAVLTSYVECARCLLEMVLNQR